MLCMSFLQQECCVVLSVPQTLSFLFPFSFESCPASVPVCAVLCVSNCFWTLHSSMCYAKSYIPQVPAASLRLHSDATLQLQMQHYMLLDMHVLPGSQEKASRWTDLTFALFSTFSFLSRKSFDHTILMQIHGKDLQFLQKLPSMLQQIRVHFNQTVLTRHTSITSERSWINSSWAWDLRLHYRKDVLNNTCAWDSFPEQGACGCMSVDNCATVVCLKIDPFPTGHECTCDWALKRVRCLNILLA